MTDEPPSGDLGTCTTLNLGSYCERVEYSLTSI